MRILKYLGGALAAFALAIPATASADQFETTCQSRYDLNRRTLYPGCVPLYNGARVDGLITGTLEHRGSNNFELTHARPVSRTQARIVGVTVVAGRHPVVVVSTYFPDGCYFGFGINRSVGDREVRIDLSLLKTVETEPMGCTMAIEAQTVPVVFHEPLGRSGTYSVIVNGEKFASFEYESPYIQVEGRVQNSSESP